MSGCYCQILWADRKFHQCQILLEQLGKALKTSLFMLIFRPLHALHAFQVQEVQYISNIHMKQMKHGDVHGPIYISSWKMTVCHSFNSIFIYQGHNNN